MKAIMLKEFRQLKSSEQKRIIDDCNKAVNKELFDRLDAEIINAQTIWIRMAIVNMAQCGFDKDKIIEFLGSWKSIYKHNKRISSTKEQDEWLNGKIIEIFGESEFVTNYIESLKKY